MAAGLGLDKKQEAVLLLFLGGKLFRFFDFISIADPATAVGCTAFALRCPFVSRPAVVKSDFRSRLDVADGNDQHFKIR